MKISVLNMVLKHLYYFPVTYEFCLPMSELKRAGVE